MIAPRIPPDEAERLEDVRALRILDTPPEQRFDRIVSLAKQALGVSMAYIALVDHDRQWFKSKCGLEVNGAPRSISFCGHTILQKEPLIISDAAKDPRFRDNPLVTGKPRIRFYAGYPLAGPRGHHVGTLCIADREVRQLDSSERRLLEQLARLAEHELNMVDVIAAQRELLETKTKLIETQEQLENELDEAARYVRSLLPAPMRDDGVHIDWHFEASSKLGGDIFGYQWLDDARLALFVIDVMGHGVGSSLLASSVHTALRRRALPDVAFEDPASVVTGLNRAFPMNDHGNKFFTAWYGIYDRAGRRMTYANAGHPPGLLIDPAGNVRELKATSIMAGVSADQPVRTGHSNVAAGSHLYLYSDGAFEIHNTGGELLGLDGLRRIILASHRGDGLHLNEVYRRLCETRSTDRFEDDLSLIGVFFS